MKRVLFIFVAISVTCIANVMQGECAPDENLSVNDKMTLTVNNGSNDNLIGYGDIRRMSASRGDVYLPMVKQGKSWWYSMQRVIKYGDGTKDIEAECGLTIGETVVMDGKEWHKVALTHAKDFDPQAGQYMSTEYTLPQVVGYIREDVPEKTVYTLLNAAEYDYDPMNDLLDYNEPFFAKNTEVRVYQFAPEGETVMFGNEKYHQLLKVTAVTEGDKFGYDTRTYNTEYLSSSSQAMLGYWDVAPHIFTYAEGIGYIEGHLYDDFFYWPASKLKTSTFHTLNPQLRYITEGEQQEVVHRVKGGRRLWTWTGAVGDITVDGDAGEAQWYDLSGVSIARPTAPGLYFKKQAGKVTKHLVR